MTNERGNNSPDAMALTAGEALPTRIGTRYGVVQQLGRGGMAAVYRVRDRSHPEQMLALKQLVLSDPARDRETRALFEREFHVLSELRHPSVVAVHDFGVDVSGPYYTMELLDNGDLSTQAPWPWMQACQRMMQVCSALSLLHSRRFVHRDISPRNVRNTSDGHVKLIDFGAMVPMGPCPHAVGTPGFIAPEVVQHLAVDARTDLFSLGATLYHALTGARPFVANTLAELNDAWRHEPATPSTLAADIPSSLDALVLSLLRLDPASRPRSAFEVMQRLAAIVGKPLQESAEISRAYLATPILVGREPQRLRFRHALREAMHAGGGGVLFEAAAGLGRTRLLEACVREAKTSGATVLRLPGRAAPPEAFATARILAEQLLEALPDEASACASQAGVEATLFRAPAAAPAQTASQTVPRLRECTDVDVYTFRDALVAWWQRVAQTHFLVIAIDDVERIDDASLTVLVMLAQRARGTRLLVLSTLQTPADAQRQPGLGLLRDSCQSQELTALTARQSNALFESVFFGAPNTPLVSDRIHKLAAGNPRQTLTLAQHMLDHQVIRFVDGNWVLPTELAVSDLPANADEALRRQLVNLPELPRVLAEAQALALEGPWTRTDYAVLASDSGIQEQIDDALAALLAQGVLVEDAGAYTLSHAGTRECLVSRLTPAERVERELALARLCGQTGRPGLMEAYHLLRSNSYAPALARLAQLIDGPSVMQLLDRSPGIDLNVLVELLTKAHEVAGALGRSTREQCELTRVLVDVSIQTDATLFYKHASGLLAQLERDSGLEDYRASTNTNTSERLQHALQAAVSRYDATPEAQRVYRVDEAIKRLTSYQGDAIVIGLRTLDTTLLASLRGLLEPFSPLSPALHALWQNAVATNEFVCQGQAEQARARWLEVYAGLEHASGLPNIDRVSHAVAYGTAQIEVSLGHVTAERWIAIIEANPMLRVAAQQLRRALCIFDADIVGAEHHRKQAEVLAAQALVKEMFDTPTLFELHLHLHVRDLTGIKHAADRLGQLASRWPRWSAHNHSALACFHLLRGDLDSAKREAERALASENPEQTDPPPVLMDWASTAGTYIRILTELGQLEEARAFGLQTCARCEKHGITGSPDHVRALAMAEARLGDYASASARLDKLIEQRAHMRPSQRSLDFEARASAAIWAKDAAAVLHFSELATQVMAPPRDEHSLALTRRLREEAQKAGFSVEVPLSDFEAALLGRLRPSNHNAMDPKVAEALQPSDTAPARAQRALELLSEALGTSEGQLYYANGPQLRHVAGSGQREPSLDRFVDGYLRHQLTQAALSTIFTEARTDPNVLTVVSCTTATGQVYRVIPLSPGGATACVGMIALRARTQQVPSAEYWALSIAISQRLLALGDVATTSEQNLRFG